MCTSRQPNGDARTVLLKRKVVKADVGMGATGRTANEPSRGEVRRQLVAL